MFPHDMNAFPLSAGMLALVALAFTAGGAVKGLVGLGLPTLVVAGLGLAMPVSQAAAWLLVPSLVTNAWQMAAGGRLRALCLRLWPLLAGSIVGTVGIGAWLGPPDAPWARQALGAALLAYAALGLFDVRQRLPAGWGGPAGGAVAGLLTGATTAVTGIFVIPSVPYLQGLRLDKDELVQAMGLSFFLSTLALGATLATVGALRADGLGASGLALLPTVAGLWLGRYVRGRLSAQAFKRCFFVALLGLGIRLILG